MTRWLLLAWLALVPLAPLLPIAVGVAWYAHLLLVALLALVVTPGLLRAGRHGTPPLRAGVPLLAVGLALLSLALAVGLARPEASRQELFVAGLTGLAHAAFFLLCLRELPDADAGADVVRRTRHWLVAALLLLLAGQLVAVLMEGQLLDPLHRPDGTLGSPNVLGTLVGATMLALIGWLGLRGWRLLRLTPLLPYLLLTRSRGAVLATGITLLLLAVHWRLRALVVAVVALAALVLLVPNPLSARLAALHPDHEFSRPFLWASAIERGLDRPLGIGPGMNRYDFPAHAWDPDHPWLLHQRRSIGLTHNVFTTLWLEWGWLAAFAMAGLTLFATWKLLRSRLLDDDPLALGAALGACVLFLELQVDGIEQNPIAFSVFLLLLATAMTRVSRRALSRGPRVPGLLAAAVVLLLAGSLLVGAGLRAAQSWRLHQAQALVAEFEAAHDPTAPPSADGGGAPDVEAVRAALELAERQVPHDADAALGRFLFERNRVLRIADEPAQDEAASRRRAEVLAEATGEAYAALQRARVADGLDPELPELGARFALARFYKLGHGADDLNRYLRLKREALALDPLDVEGHWALAQEAQRNHRQELMDEEVGQVFRLEPDYAYAWYVLARLAHADGARERSLYCYLRASEAVLNCQIKVRVANTASQAFFQANLDRVSLEELWKHIWELRRELYF